MENKINMDEQKQAKILAQLKSSYDMYETTKKQTEKRMKEQLNADGTKKYTKDKIDEEINLITEAQNDVVAQYVMCGGKEEDIRKKTKKKTANLTKEGVAKTIADMVNEMDNDRKDALDKAISVTATNIEKTYIPTSNQATIDAAFDVIPLPSKGEGYKDKIGKVSVSYLTAWDENMIVSLNMYKGNLILDYILQVLHQISLESIFRKPPISFLRNTSNFLQSALVCFRVVTVQRSEPNVTECSR